MPSRNILKIDTAQSYYHIYARGINKSPIFLQNREREFFMSLFSRYLSQRVAIDRSGTLYPNYSEQLQVLAYCLMGNHFHLLIYQEEERAMQRFMRSLMTSYSRYFNFTNQRTGPLFESRYKAARVNSQGHLEHVSRYIHLNPRYWKRYPYSSIAYYKSGHEPEWLTTSIILNLFADRATYIRFIEDYEGHKKILDQIKQELAS